MRADYSLKNYKGGAFDITTSANDKVTVVSKNYATGTFTLDFKGFMATTTVTITATTTSGNYIFSTTVISKAVNLTASPTSLTFEASGGTTTLTLSPADFKAYIVESENNWLSSTKLNNIISVNCSTNTNDARNGNIKIYPLLCNDDRNLCTVVQVNQKAGTTNNGNEFKVSGYTKDFTVATAYSSDGATPDCKVISKINGSDANWTAKSNTTWITTGTSNFTLNKNESTSTRKGTIIYTQTDTEKTVIEDSDVFKIKHKGKWYTSNFVANPSTTTLSTYNLVIEDVVSKKNNSDVNYSSSASLQQNVTVVGSGKNYVITINDGETTGKAIIDFVQEGTGKKISVTINVKQTLGGILTFSVDENTTAYVVDKYESGGGSYYPDIISSKGSEKIAWTATSSCDWVTPTTRTGNGSNWNGNGFTIKENTSTVDRTPCKVTFVQDGGKTIEATINQKGKEKEEDKTKTYTFTVSSQTTSFSYDNCFEAAGTRLDATNIAIISKVKQSGIESNVAWTGKTSGSWILPKNNGGATIDKVNGVGSSYSDGKYFLVSQNNLLDSRDGSSITFTQAESGKKVKIDFCQKGRNKDDGDDPYKKTVASYVLKLDKEGLEVGDTVCATLQALYDDNSKEDLPSDSWTLSVPNDSSQYTQVDKCVTVKGASASTEYKFKSITPETITDTTANAGTTKTITAVIWSRSYTAGSRSWSLGIDALVDGAKVASTSIIVEGSEEKSTSWSPASDYNNIVWRNDTTITGKTYDYAIPSTPIETSICADYHGIQECCTVKITEALFSGSRYMITEPSASNINWDDTSVNVSCKPLEVKYLDGTVTAVTSFSEGVTAKATYGSENKTKIDSSSNLTITGLSKNESEECTIRTWDVKFSLQSLTILDDGETIEFGGNTYTSKSKTTFEQGKKPDCSVSHKNLDVWMEFDVYEYKYWILAGNDFDIKPTSFDPTPAIGSYRIYRTIYKNGEYQPGYEDVTSTAIIKYDVFSGDTKLNTENLYSVGGEATYDSVVCGDVIEFKYSLPSGMAKEETNVAASVGSRYRQIATTVCEITYEFILTTGKTGTSAEDEDKRNVTANEFKARVNNGSLFELENPDPRKMTWSLSDDSGSNFLNSITSNTFTTTVIMGQNEDTVYGNYDGSIVEIKIYSDSVFIETDLKTLEYLEMYFVAYEVNGGNKIKVDLIDSNGTSHGTPEYTASTSYGSGRVWYVNKDNEKVYLNTSEENKNFVFNGSSTVLNPIKLPAPEMMPKYIKKGLPTDVYYGDYNYGIGFYRNTTLIVRVPTIRLVYGGVGSKTPSPKLLAYIDVDGNGWTF